MTPAIEQDEITAGKIEFERNHWLGCESLNCLPGCSHNSDRWRCEQFERAFAKWFGFPPQEGERHG